MSTISTSKKYIAVGILCFINLINYMDRFTVAGVLPEIKAYYGFNDAQGGLLQTAFIVSYMVMAPLFGYMGDRYSRKYLMAFGVLFWSLTTYLGSIIPSGHAYWFIFLRAMVGTGEASYSTIAPTIIGDLFTGLKRTKVLSAFYFAIPVGSGMGYIVGEQLAKAFGEWHYALRLTPILGLLSIALMLTFLEEPTRGHADGIVSIVQSDLKSDLLYITTVPTYIWSSVGFTCVCFVTGSLSWWAPTFMKYALKSLTGKDNDNVTLIFGIITCLGGIVGVGLGTLSAERLRKITRRADPLICSISVFLATPFIFLALAFAIWIPVLTWIFIAFGVTLLCVNWTLIADMLLSIIVPHRRSLAQSIQILFSHLLGDATSPYIIGLISDAIQGSKTFSSADESQARSLQYAMYTNCIVLVAGGAALYYASIFIEKDEDSAKASIQGDQCVNSSGGERFPPAIDDESLTTFPPADSIFESDTHQLID